MSGSGSAGGEGGRLLGTTETSRRGRRELVRLPGVDNNNAQPPQLSHCGGCGAEVVSFSGALKHDEPGGGAVTRLFCQLRAVDWVLRSGHLILRVGPSGESGEWCA